MSLDYSQFYSTEGASAHGVAECLTRAISHATTVGEIINAKERLTNEGVLDARQALVNFQTEIMRSYGQLHGCIHNVSRPQNFDQEVQILELMGMHLKRFERAMMKVQKRRERTPAGLFKGLPAELRNKIYYLVIKEALPNSEEEPDTIFWWFLHTAKNAPRPALSLTCRQIRGEMDYLIKQKTFTISIWNHLRRRFEKTSLQHVRDKIEGVEVFRESPVEALQYKRHPRMYYKAQRVNTLQEARKLARVWSAEDHIYVAGTMQWHPDIGMSTLAWAIASNFVEGGEPALVYVERPSA